MEEYREQLDAFVQGLGFVALGDTLWQRKTDGSNLILSLVMVGDTPHVKIANGETAYDVTYFQYALQGPVATCFQFLKRRIEFADNACRMRRELMSKTVFKDLAFGPDKSLSGQLGKRQTHTDDPRQSKPL